MTSSFRPRLMAAFVACLALAAPAQAQFNPFNRQPAPPADVPGGDSNEAADLVLRVNRLEEELRQANGRIEELENAEHRLELQLQKFRQDVEYRFGDRSEGASPGARRRRATRKPGRAGGAAQAEKVGRIRPRRRSERAWRSAAARGHAAERAARARDAAFRSRRSTARTRQGGGARDEQERGARDRADDRRLRGRDARSAA